MIKIKMTNRATKMGAHTGAVTNHQLIVIISVSFKIVSNTKIDRMITE